MATHTLPIRFRRRRAFTVLELIVVVVILGILTTLLLIRLDSTAEKSYRAVMQSDLRNFVSARALQVAEAGSVPMSVDDIAGFSFSEGVEEIAYSSNSATEYSLQVGHSRTSAVCEIDAAGSTGTHRISCVGRLNSAPLASFEASEEVAVEDQPITFTSTSTDPDGDDLEAMWDFDGDGIPDATGDVVSHVFGSGSAQVTLTVRDPQGRESVATRNFSSVRLYLAADLDGAAMNGVWPEQQWSLLSDIPLPSGVKHTSSKGCGPPSVLGLNRHAFWLRGTGAEAEDVLYRVEVEYFIHSPSDIGTRFYLYTYTYMGRLGGGWGTCNDGGKARWDSFEWRHLRMERAVAT